MAKKKKVDEVTRQQRAARYILVPFAVDVVTRRKPRRFRSWLLPVGQPARLTAETVSALSDVMNRGVMAFLVREGGWRMLPYVIEGREQPVEDVRLSDRQVWGDSNVLRFTQGSVDSLLIAFNATVMKPVSLAEQSTQRADYRSQAEGRGGYEDFEMPQLESNGDLLLHHIIEDRVRALGVPLKPKESEFFEENPWTRVMRLKSSVEQAEVDLRRIFAEDMRPFLPWLNRYIKDCWRPCFDQSWTTLEIFDGFQRRAAAIFGNWMLQCEQHGRRDILVPMMDVFLELFTPGIEQRWLERFDSLTRSLPHRERQAYRDRWAAVMQRAVFLQAAYAQARQIHPIEREAGDRVYMSAYEQRKFADVSERAEQLVREITATIG